MVIEQVVALGVLLLAVLHDVKTREVPDKLSYGLIAIGIFLGVVRAVTEQNILILGYVLLGGVAGYLLGALMYYTGQWGGGDAKIMIGLGTLLGFSFTEFPLILTLFVSILLGGAAYGIIYTSVLAIRKWKLFKEEFRVQLKEQKIMRWIGLSFVLLLLVLAMFVPPYMKLGIVTIALTIYLALHLVIMGKAVEKVCMHKDIAVTKLVPGDWLLQEIKHENTVLVPQRNIGLVEEDIKALKEHHIKTVQVKEGIPFLPAFLIGYLGILFFGNWMSIVQVLF